MLYNQIKKKNFCILLPPPNVTGELHIGHFFQYFIIDIIIKWKIIQGYKINYLFGFDHAGISAIFKFKSKKNILLFFKLIKIDLLNQMFYINFYTKIKKIEFTLNKEYKKIVIAVFKKLFFKKIIYIKKKILNFSRNKIIPNCEIKEKYFKNYFYYIKFKNKIKYIIIKSKNLKSIITSNTIVNFKKKIEGPFKNNLKYYFYNNEKNNFFNLHLFLKYNKLKINFIFFNIFNKLKKYEIIKNKIKCKKILQYKFFSKNKIIKYLIKNNYLLCIKKKIQKKFFFKNKKIKKNIIDQWFISIRNFLSIKFLLKKILFNKSYNDFIIKWILTISDWCISRQINWGVRIPIYIDLYKYIYLYKYNRLYNYKKEKEVLDTWFNSSIWSIYQFKKIKIKQDILISGFDIVFFWIIKIIIINYYFVKKSILKSFFLHGLLVISNKKISKSINNFFIFKKIKFYINLYKKFLIKNILKKKIKISNIFFSIKNKYKLLKKLLIDFEIIKIYFNAKKYIIKNLKNFNFEINKFNILSKNFISKKIFLYLNKIKFPIKNKILYYNWNYTINFLSYKNIINFFYIILFLKKKYFLKKNYFAIFYKIKIIFYVKYKNKKF